jgi:hypothetical protein
MKDGAGFQPGSFFQTTADSGPPARGKEAVMSKKITIAFPEGGIIPGTVLGSEADRSCSAMEPVSVPEVYGRHLVEDRFAVEVTHQGKGKKKAEAGSVKGSKADDDGLVKESDEVIAARAAVAEAEQLVAASGSDLAAKAEADAMLKAAQEKLATIEA